MLDRLHEVENILPDLIKERKWYGQTIEYGANKTDRVWTPYEDGSIDLHRLYPCSIDEAIFHHHEGPTAVKVFQGSYLMKVGSKTRGIDETIMTILVVPGCTYQMLNQEDYHSVAPNEIVYSLRIRGKPFEEHPDKVNLSSNCFKTLSESEKESLLDCFNKILE